MSSKRRKNDTEAACGGTKKEKLETGTEIPAVFRDAELTDKLKEAWCRKQHFSHGDVELDCYPFPHVVLKNFIQDRDFLDNLQRELLDLNFHQKSNDLYKFMQSDDLKKRKEPHIVGLRESILQEFRVWLTGVLEVELTPVVDISCAKYEYTDVLLCHDDELEGRRIAFILYLVPEWDAHAGGLLDLYAVDENLLPRDVVKSLVPAWNKLVFFEVSPLSFHQVSEVVAEDKCRLAVSGWFHGTSLERPPRYVEPPVPRNPHLPRDEELLLEWINPTYLDIAYQAQVQEGFEESSEILLKSFLLEEKFREVNSALKEANICWFRRGPPNKRCYEKAELCLPPSVSACWELFSSEAFFLLLSNLTGLKLHYLAPNSDSEEEEGAERRRDNENSYKEPVCRGELRRWRCGDYTLVHDTDLHNTEFALDLLMYFGCEDWEAEFGGFTSYIASGEDEELLTVLPVDNCLGLVYRDKETLKFVKHVNHRSSHRTFYDFSFVYYE